METHRIVINLRRCDSVSLRNRFVPVIRRAALPEGASQRHPVASDFLACRHLFNNSACVVETFRLYRGSILSLIIGNVLFYAIALFLIMTSIPKRRARKRTGP